MSRCHRTAIALSSLVLLHSLRGTAQTSSGDVMIATQLFDDAEKLMTAGHAAAACPKYRESQRRDPQLGTLLHLADCWEQVGKTASAWAAFKEAAEIAARRNASGRSEPREKTALARATALEKRVSRLTIKVVNAGTPGLEVRQGGELVNPAVWGSAVPVDPGVYTLTAYAPGKKLWTKMVEVQSDGDVIEVTVPLLDTESNAVRMVAPPATSSGLRTIDAVDSPTMPTSSGSAQRTAGFVVGGVGVATLGVGVVFGSMRNAKVSESEAICPTGVGCSPGQSDQIRALENEARTNVTRFYVASGVGAALLLGGIVLILTAPSAAASKNSALWIETFSGPSVAGASLIGQW